MISLSPDLKRLHSEGYDIELRGAFLLLRSVPYVTSRSEIRHGVLISELESARSPDTPIADHTVWFEGEIPCDANGVSLADRLEPGGTATAGERRELGEGVYANFQFSRKPPSGYHDYYEKMTTYEDAISRHARMLDPDVTAKTFEVTQSQDSDSPFNYADTASVHAQIGVVNEKLKLGPVAIVGLGGTGSYILDLVAKTPVKEIHLFDNDKFGQHNAFRAPGAPSIETLRSSPQKVSYFNDIYSAMHRGIVSHASIDETTVELLRGMDFVFLAMGANRSRDLAVAKLKEYGVPFVDVGMGIFKEGDALGGTVRATFNESILSTPGADGGIYASNIQVADLNALNAALAVIKWKKVQGFYFDLDSFKEATYQIESGVLIRTPED